MSESISSTSFLKGSLIYFVSNLVNACIPLILMPVLTRYLTPEEYGEVAIFQTLLGALLALMGLSMHGAAARKYFDTDNAELSEFIGACCQILLVTSILTMLCVLLVLEKLSGWLGLMPLWIILAVGVAGADMIVQLCLGQWLVTKQAKKYGVLQVFRSLMNMLLSLLLVVVLLQGAEGRMGAQAIVTLLIALISLNIFHKSHLLKFFTWRPDLIKDALNFGLPLVPHACGLFLLSMVDRFLINSELGLEKTGIYMVAAQLAAGAMLVFDALNKAYVPWLYERLKQNQDSEKRQIVKYTYIWFVIILSGALIAFVLAPWLIEIMAGEQFKEAEEIIGWLILGQVFGGMYLMVTNYVFYSKKTGMLSTVTLFCGLFNVLLLVVFIKDFGVKGAAFAFCISMALRFILTWWVAQKHHPMPWFNLLTKN